ncbi:sensor histidine kinase [Gulosibacter sp. 10]|uniref:sensor histidine kinase n=1 Tax=Gulosibacter sp. 10 TaxID=1255570 RepID=UPI00097F49BA|nr:histidine kinase [Gulosibacter sp. 10]SJM61655.1 two-component system sensor kinase [Gulosibacter sp. 10]
MQDSFIASHERPLRVLLMDALGTLAAFPVVFVMLFTSPMGTPLSSIALMLIVLRRVAPLTLLWLSTVLAGTTYALVDEFQMVADMVVLVGVHSVAAFGPARMRFYGFVPLLLALVLMAGQLFFGWFPNAGSWFGGIIDPTVGPEVFIQFVMISGVCAVAFLAAWALGMLRRSQFTDVMRQRERADLLERDAHRLAELAVTDERARIAREMHDIIAHSLASILTLAEGGRMGTKQPGSEFSNRLFAKISEASRSALGDVKLLLRQVDSPQDERPTQGAGDIGELVETTRLAGLPIEFSELGERRELPSGLSLAIYRVAQESITNILKHAPGARCEMRLVWDEEKVTLTTLNELPEPGREASPEAEAAASSGSGRGLVGMRERMAIFDGSIDVTRTGHVFQIQAAWPYP